MTPGAAPPRELACLECGTITTGDHASTCGGDRYDLADPDHVEQLRLLLSGRLRRRDAWVFGAALLYAVGTGNLIALVVVLAVWYVVRPLTLRRSDRAVADRISLTSGDVGRARWLTGAAPVAAAVVIAIHAHVSRLPEHVLAPFAIQGTQLALRPWTLLTHGLLHVSWTHVVANALGLLLVSHYLELRLRRGQVLGLLVAGVVAGGLGLAFARPGALGVGISGGVYALIGAEAALNPRRRRLAVAYLDLVLPNWAVALGRAVLFAAIDALSRSNVAWEAHLAGFAVGALLGLALRRVAEPELASRLERLREAELDGRQRQIVS